MPVILSLLSMIVALYIYWLISTDRAPGVRVPGGIYFQYRIAIVYWHQIESWELEMPVLAENIFKAFPSFNPYAGGG